MKSHVFETKSYVFVTKRRSSLYWKIPKNGWNHDPWPYITIRKKLTIICHVQRYFLFVTNDLEPLGHNRKKLDKYETASLPHGDYTASAFLFPAFGQATDRIGAPLLYDHGFDSCCSRRIGGFVFSSGCETPLPYVTATISIVAPMSGFIGLLSRNTLASFQVPTPLQASINSLQHLW